MDNDIWIIGPFRQLGIELFKAKPTPVAHMLKTIFSIHLPKEMFCVLIEISLNLVSKGLNKSALV